jgi:hypothetical protein
VQVYRGKSIDTHEGVRGIGVRFQEGRDFARPKNEGFQVGIGRENDRDLLKDQGIADLFGAASGADNLVIDYG